MSALQNLVGMYLWDFNTGELSEIDRLDEDPPRIYYRRLNQETFEPTGEHGFMGGERFMAYVKAGNAALYQPLYWHGLVEGFRQARFQTQERSR